MDGFVVEAAKQVPALAVMVYLVLKFLAFTEKRDRALKEISDQCHATQNRATEAMIKNSETLAQWSELIRRGTVAMEEVEEILRDRNGKKGSL